MKKKIKTALVILAAAFFMAGCGGESTEDLTDSELKEFTNRFDSNGELFGFLLPEYESPEEIRWDRVVAYRWTYYISYKATGNGEYLTDPNVEIGSFDSLDFAKYKYQKIDYMPFAE